MNSKTITAALALSLTVIGCTQKEMSILGRKVQHPDVADRAEALAMAAQSDVIVAAMGENVLLCGEKPTHCVAIRSRASVA